ncbi:MAG: F0F1 ATP synthase subunit B [Dehalococcoidales bacterium]|jgi:F-type H+-transporting ATPase subunit b
MSGLGVSGWTLAAQVVNFIILLLLLYFFAYKPVMKMLDERSRKIKDSMEEVQKVKAQAAQTEEEFKKKIEAASKEGQEVIARAMRTGEEARQRAQAEAKQEAQALVEKARVEIQRERDETIGELRQEFADLTVVAAEKVIGKSLDKEAHRQIIDQVLDESANLKKN